MGFLSGLVRPKKASQMPPPRRIAPPACGEAQFMQLMFGATAADGYAVAASPLGREYAEEQLRQVNQQEEDRAKRSVEPKNKNKKKKKLTKEKEEKTKETRVRVVPAEENNPLARNCTRLWSITALGSRPTSREILCGLTPQAGSPSSLEAVVAFPQRRIQHQGHQAEGSHGAHLEPPQVATGLHKVIGRSITHPCASIEIDQSSFADFSGLHTRTSKEVEASYRHSSGSEGGGLSPRLARMEKKEDSRDGLELGTASSSIYSEGRRWPGGMSPVACLGRLDSVDLGDLPLPRRMSLE